MDPSKLKNYHGTWLTEPEIQLSKLFEAKHQEREAERQAERKAKKLMAEKTRDLQTRMEDHMERLKQEAAAAAAAAAEQAAAAEKKAKQEAKAKMEEKLKEEKRKKEEKKRIEQEKKQAERLQVGGVNNESEEDVEEDDSQISSDRLTLQQQQDASGISIKRRKNGLLDSELETMAEDAVDADPEALFSAPGILSSTEWNSTTSKESAQWILENFDLEDDSDDDYDDNDNDYDDEEDEGRGQVARSDRHKKQGIRKQTLGLKITVPNESKSWSFNISPPNDMHGCNVLLHFNPRYTVNRDGHKIVLMTDKQGTWGSPIRQPMGNNSREDGLVARQIDLMVQLRSDGFYIFANGIFSRFFPHRRHPKKLGIKSLKFTMNATDDNGNPQQVILHKVWWGWRSPSKDSIGAGGNLQDNADEEEDEEEEDGGGGSRGQKRRNGMNHWNSKNPAAMIRNLLQQRDRQVRSGAIAYPARSIVVKGLPVGVWDLVECQAMEYTLMQLFLEFGTEAVTVVPGHGTAFVRFAKQESVEPAIEELNNCILGGEDDDAEEDAEGGGGDKDTAQQFELILEPLEL